MKKGKGVSERGSILIMAVVLSFAIFLMGLSFLTSVDYFENSVSKEISEAQKLYDAYIGNRLETTQLKTGRDFSTSFGNWIELFENNWYRAMVSFLGGNNGDFTLGSSRGYIVYGSGRSTFYGSDHMFEETMATYEVLETFADYLYISDKEREPVRNGIVRFWTPDTLDGKVHSNDTLHISGSPCFKKLVTSSAPVTDPPNSNAVFEEGLILNAPEIYFPDQADEIRQYTYLRNFGTFDPDSATELTFNGRDIHVRYCGPDPVNSSMVCEPPYISEAETFRVPDAPGALFVHGKLFIKADRNGHDVMDDPASNWESMGFEGKLTVASSDTMFIPDNLIYRYAESDNTIPVNVRDCLGLISENFIMFGENCENITYINAAMAAINGSITVQDIYEYGTTNEKQSLNIHGSLAQKNRGLVHSSFGGGVRGFIEKDYHYDTRLQYYPPPHFLKTRELTQIYYEPFFGI